MLYNPPTEPILVLENPNHYFGIPENLFTPLDDEKEIISYLSDLESRDMNPESRFSCIDRIRSKKHYSDFTRLDTRVGASRRSIWGRQRQDVVLKYDDSPKGISGNAQEVKNHERYMRRFRGVYVHFPVYAHSLRERFVVMPYARLILSDSLLSDEKKEKIQNAASVYIPDTHDSNIGGIVDNKGNTYWATVDYDFGLVFNEPDFLGQH